MWLLMFVIHLWYIIMCYECFMIIIDCEIDTSVCHVYSNIYVNLNQYFCTNVISV